MSMSSRDIDESPGHALTGNNGDTGIERLTVLEFMRKRNPGLAASMDRIVQGIPSEADSVKLAAAL